MRHCHICRPDTQGSRLFFVSKFTAKVESGLGLEEIGSLIVSFSCPYEYRGVVEELAQLCELVSRSKAEASG
jgi:hypothetical protein